jgi:hypothetical protein
MKQPARLSAGGLGFQLVLVNQVSAAAASSLHEIPVGPEAAKDSWFPGYAWAPLVMLACGGGGDSSETAPGFKLPPLHLNPQCPICARSWCSSRKRTTLQKEFVSMVTGISMQAYRSRKTR